MDDFLQNLKEWCTHNPAVMPDDATFIGKSNSQKGEFNSHYGKKHTDQTKLLIGSKSVNRNWATGDKVAKKGKENGKAKPVEVLLNGELKKFDCLKDFYTEYDKIPYSTMKWMARTGKPSRGLTITYV